MRRPRSPSTKKTTASTRPSRSRKPAAQTLDASAVARALDYINKLAAAINSVSQAQNSWIGEIDAVAQQPSLLMDSDWRARSSQLMSHFVKATDQFEIKPLPQTAKGAQKLLDAARKEARLAGDGYADALESADFEKLVAVIQHADRVSELIQEAYALLRK